MATRLSYFLGTALAFSVMFAAFIGCGPRNRVLEFVVPDGFRGIVKIRAAVPNGTDLHSTNGKIQLLFPPSGTLGVKGQLPAFEWHTPLARYANGTSIPVSGPNANVPVESVALWGLGVKNNNTESWYLVGKANEMKGAMKEFYGFEVP